MRLDRCGVLAAVAALAFTGVPIGRANAQTPSVPLGGKLIAPDGSMGDNFGRSVAIAGDIAVVGAVYDRIGSNPNQGSAYVYAQTGSGWLLQARLIAPDGVENAYFGQSVAVSGQTLLVGASGDDSGLEGDEGAVYVFTRSGSQWALEAKLVAPAPSRLGNFGYSVALSGGVAVIGADGHRAASGNQVGAGYVFTRNEGVWTLASDLVAQGAISFGRTVAVDADDTVVVGAPSSANSQGSAFVFVRNGSTWTLQAVLSASDGAAGDVFGRAVAVYGDTALVTASDATVEQHYAQGAAYVFQREAGIWVQRGKLTASDGEPLDLFGWSVALHGDTALVGAIWDDVGANGDQGSAYLFRREGASWVQRGKLVARDGDASDWFGFSVALSNDAALIGEPRDTVNGEISRGSATVVPSAIVAGLFSDGFEAP